MESIKSYECKSCGAKQATEHVTSCIYCGNEVKIKIVNIIKNYDDFMEALSDNAIVEYHERDSIIERDFLREQVKKLREANEEYTIFSMIDGENFSYNIDTGYHFVNVIGYYLVKGIFIIKDENNNGSTTLLVN